MQRAKIVAAAIVALLTLIVVLQNTQAVETKLLFVTVTMPRALLLVVTLLAGFIIGILTVSHYARKTRKQDAVPPGR